MEKEQIKQSVEDTKPLTDWKNPPKLMDLTQDYEEAKIPHQKQVERIDEWLDNLFIKDSAKIPKVKGRSSVQPMLIRKQAEWRYPALSEPFLSTDKLFEVNPVTWEDVEAAKQNEMILNNQFTAHIDKVNFVDQFIRAVVNEGTAVLRTGWKYEDELVTVEKPIVEYVPNPMMAEVFAQIDQLKAESPSQYITDVEDHMKAAYEQFISTGIPYEPIITGYEEVEETKVISNHPTVEVCDYQNVIFDPTCGGDISKAKFAIYRFTSSMSELKKDGRYKNLDKVLVNTQSVLNEPDYVTEEERRNFDFKDDPRKQFVVYEYWGYWDIHGTGQVEPFVAAWVGGTLIRMEENPYPDKKIPFVTVPYLPVKNSLYGEPDGELLKDNQKISGSVMRGMIDLMARSANSQTGIRKDMLDATQLRNYENGKDYFFNPSVDPRAGVFMHTFPDIPASAQYILEIQNQEAESITGVKSFHQGVSAASLGEVAAGIRGALDASSKRELTILRRVAKGLVEVGRKFIAMNSEFLSEEEVIRITNDQFVTIRRDDLGGKFDLKLTISTAEEDASKAQELAFMLQTMGNSVDFNVTKLLLEEIAELRKMPHLVKRIRDYQPQPDPLAQRKAELEIAKLEAEIETERAKAAQIYATAGLNQSKVGTEEAKANYLRSDTDMRNLDFVEQESGVKQERDLQKMRAQAEAQAATKVVEAGLKSADKPNQAINKFMYDRRT